MRSYRRLLYVLAVCLLHISFAHAQTNSPTKPPNQPRTLEQDFFRNILKDQKAIWTSPLHLKKEDAKWIIPSAIGFGALLATDRTTGDEIAESSNQVTTSNAISYIGSLYSLAAFSGTFYLIGRERKDDHARETGLLSGEALLDSVIVGGALKGISQRGRPASGHERSEFFEGGSSFPSGHSIQVWSVATVVAHEYSRSRAVQIAAYSLASAVSVARYTAQKHYLSDVLVGSALGFGIGRYVYKAHHREPAESSEEAEPFNHKSTIAIVPMYNRHAGQYGIALTWSH